MKRILLLSLLWLTAISALAHKDRRLSLAADGSVPELPPAYAATRIQIEFSERGTGQLTKLTFASAGRQTVVKSCVRQLVAASSRDRVALAGSWYHDKRLLPDYVHILFKASTIQASLPEDPGVLFLFSLTDARLLEVQEIVPLPEEQAVQYRKVTLKSGCPSRQ